MRIFINPGHADGGKPDPGAVNPNFHGYRLCEYDLARKIGDAAAGYLRAIGEEVRVLQSHNLLGECPAYPCVVDVANTWGADLFLSIHINAGGGRGCETFCYRANSSGMEFARAIQNELHRTLYMFDKGFQYRGVFTRPTLAVLRGTAMPAALVEVGFIDSDDAFLLLRNLNDIARAIARGVTDYQCLTTRGENRA